MPACVLASRCVPLQPLSRMQLSLASGSIVVPAEALAFGTQRRRRIARSSACWRGHGQCAEGHFITASCCSARANHLQQATRLCHAQEPARKKHKVKRSGAPRAAGGARCATPPRTCGPQSLSSCRTWSGRSPSCASCAARCNLASLWRYHGLFGCSIEASGCYRNMQEIPQYQMVCLPCSLRLCFLRRPLLLLCSSEPVQQQFRSPHNTQRPAPVIRTCC